MDLLKPVILKKRPFDYQLYCRSVTDERVSSIKVLEDENLNWIVPKALIDKVDERGNLRPFFGDTVVFACDQEMITKLSVIQQKIYEGCDQILAYPLDPDKFHLTLHDLYNGREDIRKGKALLENKKKIEKIFIRLKEYLDKHPKHGQVSLVSDYLYPCYNIAVLLGFVPATESDYRILINCYNLFEEVYYLDYWPRFHVTLGYFRPWALHPRQINLLKDAINMARPKQLTLKINLAQILYQHFSDMNNYQTILVMDGPIINEN